MDTRQQLQELLGPTDPARFVKVTPTLPARQVILRAESSYRPSPRSSPAWHRRIPIWVAAPALAAVALVAVAVVAPRSTKDGVDLPPQGGTAVGVVLEPIAYQIQDDAPAAGPALRKLADTIGKADYDGKTGTYAYHHLRSWGSTRALGPGNRNMGLAQETWMWCDANGVGEIRTRELQPEFPDEESRQYWQAILDKEGTRGTTAAPIVASSGTVDPTRPFESAAIASVLQANGCGSRTRQVSQRYLSWPGSTTTDAQRDYPGDCDRLRVPVAGCRR